MARPSFEQKQGEPPTALHLNLKRSQYDTLEQMAYDTSTSKATSSGPLLIYILTHNENCVQ